MSEESQTFDPYDAVIADLKAKRDRIDQTIQQLEALRGAGGPAPFSGSATQSVGPTTPGDINSPGAFLGMTVVEAAQKVLAARRQPLGNAQLVTAFKAGGLVMNSADPINTVGSILMRRFNQVGDIVRVSRGVWGLASWYPNRSFKKKPAKEGEKPDADNDAEDAQ